MISVRDVQTHGSPPKCVVHTTYRNKKMKPIAYHLHEISFCSIPQLLDRMDQVRNSRLTKRRSSGNVCPNNDPGRGPNSQLYIVFALPYWLYCNARELQVNCPKFERFGFPRARRTCTNTPAIESTDKSNAQTRSSMHCGQFMGSWTSVQ